MYNMTSLDFFSINFTSIIILLMLQGYLGRIIKNIYSYVLNTPIIIYLITVLFALCYMYIKIKYNIIYCLDEETDKKLVEISDPSINVNNFTVNLPNSLYKGLNNLGIGAAIGGGMKAAASSMKGIPSPPLIRLGVTIAGGYVARSLYTGANNYHRTLDNNKSNFDKSVEDKFNTKSIIEDNEILSDFYKDIIQFLEANLILHISMLYLVIILGFILLIYYFLNSNQKITKLKNILGERWFNIIYNILNSYSKFNKIWLIIVWIILFISTVGGVFFSFVLFQQIELISEIVVNK